MSRDLLAFKFCGETGPNETPLLDATIHSAKYFIGRPWYKGELESLDLGGGSIESARSNSDRFY